MPRDNLTRPGVPTDATLLGATTIKRLLPLAAIAALALPARLDAAFSYVSTPTLTSISGGSLGGTTLNVTSVSSTVPLTTPTNINLFNISVSSTTTAGTDSFTANFRHSVAITNIPPPGTAATGTLAFNFSLIFTRSDISGSLSTATALGPVTGTIDGVVYTLDNFVYAQPTTGTTGPGIGNLSARITSSAVPEPASVAMAGLGLVGVAGLALRRRTIA